MSDKDHPRLVAETDASGRVTHVWLAMPGWRHARPVRRGDDAKALLPKARVHGAKRDDIAVWLQRQG